MWDCNPTGLTGLFVQSIGEPTVKDNQINHFVLPYVADQTLLVPIFENPLNFLCLQR